MPHKKCNPGCPCCGSCVLVSDDFSADSQQWTLVDGDEADWSIAAGELQLSDAVELLHDTPHPASPGSLTIGVSIWSTADGQPEILLASNLDGSTSLIVRFFNLGESCGEMRVYHRVAGVETLISQQHVVAPLPVETWLDVVICWNAAEQALTISLPSVESDASSLPSVTEYPSTAVSGLFFGLGNSGSDAVAFDNLSVAKVDDGEDSGAANCPTCTPSCLLASEPSPGTYPCLSTRTGTWTAVDGNYEGAAGSTYFHKTRITETHYVVRAVWADFGYDETTGAADKIRVYYTSTLYAEYTVTKPSPFFGTYRLTVNINGSAGVTNTINFAKGQLSISVCVRPGQVTAYAELWREGGFLGNYRIRTAANYTQGAGPFDCGVSSVANTNKLSLFGVYRHIDDNVVCYECAVLCGGCETPLPERLTIDLGDATLTNNLLQCCDQVAGRWTVEAATTACTWQMRYALCLIGCDHPNCADPLYQNVVLFIYLQALLISSTPPTYGWRASVTLTSRTIFPSPDYCIPYCPQLGKHVSAYYETAYPEAGCDAFPIVLAKYADGVNTACTGSLPDEITLDIA